MAFAGNCDIKLKFPFIESRSRLVLLSSRHILIFTKFYILVNNAIGLFGEALGVVVEVSRDNYGLVRDELSRKAVFCYELGCSRAKFGPDAKVLRGEFQIIYSKFSF